MASVNPGIYITRASGADIVVPATNETVAWDSTMQRWIFWNGSIWEVVAENIVDIQSGNPQSDIVNDNTLNTVYTKSIPGGTLGPNNGLRVTHLADIGNTTGTHHYSVTVTFGATVIVSGSTIAVAPNASPPRAPVSLEFLFQNLGATNAQYCQGQLSQGPTSAAAGVLGVVANSLQSWITATEDTTATKTLMIQIQLDAALTTFDYRTFMTLVELV